MHDAFGRPIDFGEDTKDMILDIAHGAYEGEKALLCVAYSIQGKKRNLGKIPGVSTILKLKREMRFNVTRVAIHLELNSSMMKERLIYAKIYVQDDWSRIIEAAGLTISLSPREAPTSIS